MRRFTNGLALDVLTCCIFFAVLWANTGVCQLPTYLKASNAEASDFFGTSVASSGLTLVVGAPGEESNATTVNGDESNNDAFDRGAAYVFVQDKFGVWSQQAYLKVAKPAASNFNNIADSVAISGNTVVVSSPWSAIGTGGPRGLAWVFVRNGDVWTQQATLHPPNGGNDNAFGAAVAISGNTIVVGDSFEDSIAGVAYVFVRDQGDTWSRQATLMASNREAGDQFGNHVAISGDTVVVGTGLEDSNATGVDGDGSNNLAESSGAAYVFFRDENESWSQQAYLKASNTDAKDSFGSSVGVSGDTIVIGAYSEDSDASGINGDDSNNLLDRAGAAYVFLRDGETWSQHSYLKALNVGIYDQFGTSVAIEGDWLAVSAVWEDESVTDSGAAYVFKRDDIGEWSEIKKLKPSNPGLSYQMGLAMAISNDILVAGTWLEDSNATGINGDGDNQLAENSGAAYAFTLADISDTDTTPPVVTAPPNILEFTTEQFTMVDLGTATATDDSGTVVSIDNDWPGGGFPVGETIVTWTATDEAGNMGTDTQHVTIIMLMDEDEIFSNGFE